MKNIQKIVTNSIFATAIAFPLIAYGHGGVDDGHVEGNSVNTGASALLEPFSAEWWGLLLISIILTAILSFGVWKYLEVPLPKESAKEKATTHTDKKA